MDKKIRVSWSTYVREENFIMLINGFTALSKNVTVSPHLLSCSSVTGYGKIEEVHYKFFFR